MSKNELIKSYVEHVLMVVFWELVLQSAYSIMIKYKANITTLGLSALPDRNKK